MAPSSPAPRPRGLHSATTAALIFGVALLSAIAASCLPDNPYQRFQLLDGTIYKKLRWNYERIHYDPRPIDVAIIGSSKSLLGLSADRMEQRLAALGKPAHVANLSVVASGRNIEWVVANELFKAKRPKVVVVLIDETPFKFGHMAFKYVASPRDVAAPPAPFLHNYLYDVSYLPYRQMELFGASLFPAAFGLQPAFDPAGYAATRSDYTSSFRGHGAAVVDMEHQVPAAVLASDERRTLGREKRSLVPRAISNVVEADDPVYTREIVRQAAAHGAKVVFIYVPIFNGTLEPSARAFYARYGVVEDYGDLATQSELYSQWPHLNHAGAMILSDRVATAVASDIEAPR